MLSIIEIENSDYSINDIADLKRRFDLAVTVLETVAHMTRTGSMYQYIQDQLTVIIGDHVAPCVGIVEPNNNRYMCDCPSAIAKPHNLILPESPYG
jgi:hypothetical protein